MAAAVDESLDVFRALRSAKYLNHLLDTVILKHMHAGKLDSSQPRWL